MDHSTIINRWPSIADFASDIGVPEGTAKQMRNRNSINGRYWADAVTGAAHRGLDGITLEALAVGARESA